jgi:high frequency lysogenization protein
VSKNLEDQLLALAGVAQVAHLVDRISKTGNYDSEALTHSVNSLFAFDANSTADVYGGVMGVRMGLEVLASILANKDSDRQRDVVRYVFNLLYLERRFATNPDMMSVVHSRLEHTRFKSEHFTSHVQETCHSLSGIYQDTLSTFKYRIRVTGSVQQLENKNNADLIRALLLAGIRSAFLWRQLGGRRYKLLFQRKQLLQLARELSRSAASV